ncbi:MAG TPA: cytochrome C [Cytophagales bacterium]|jgi:cytochrome c551/c552|nr:cytochrome C [Cytophagales bacterium]
MKFFSFAFLALFFVTSSQISAEEIDSDKIFQYNCSVCHTVGGGKVVGPDLMGLKERREKTWLRSFIVSSSGMIQAGDELAIEVFNEHNQVPMPDHKHLSDNELNALVNWIFEQEAVTEVKATEEISSQNGIEETESMESDSTGFSLDSPVNQAILGLSIATFILLISAVVLLFFIVKMIRMINCK